MVWLSLRLASLVLLSFFVLTFLAPAQAQEEATAAGTTWYMHEFTSPDGAGAYLDFLPTGEDETDQTTTPNPSTSPYTFTVAAKDPLASALLAAEGASTATVFLKAFNGVPAGPTKVTIEVLAGDAAIASGELEQDVGVNAIVQYDVPLTATVTEIPAGTLVAMRTTIENTLCGCFSSLSYPRGVSTDHPWSFTLPVAAGASDLPDLPSVVFEDLAVGPFTVNVTSGNGTAADRQYNWTADLSDVVVEFASNGTGTAVLEILSAAGNKTLGNGTGNGTGAASGTGNATGTDGNATAPALLSIALNGTANKTAELRGLKAGPVAIRLGLSEFNGSVILSIRSAPALKADANTTGAGNASLAVANDAEAKASPGLALPLVAAALAAVVASRRRSMR